MTEKVYKIEKWIKEKIACWCNESQCEVTELPKQIIEGKILALREILSFIDSLQEEPVSEELEKAAVEAFKKIVDDGRNSFFEIFKAGAEWQITKLMKDATEVIVAIDAGGYPYIPQIELYDYDKDIPLAKEGDKYKVVLIKED